MQEEKEGSAKLLLLLAWQPTQSSTLSDHSGEPQLRCFQTSPTITEDVDWKASNCLQEGILKPRS